MINKKLVEDSKKKIRRTILSPNITNDGVLQKKPNTEIKEVLYHAGR